MTEVFGIPVNASGLLLVLVWTGVVFCAGMTIWHVVTSRKRRYEDLERHLNDPPPRKAQRGSKRRGQ